ncbi:MAG: hypothetical protein QMB52_04625 [Propionivibrio sp.]
MPNGLPVGVVETYRELLKVWKSKSRELKCLQRLITDPAMRDIYWRLNTHFAGMRDHMRLFIREVFLAGVTADYYYAAKPKREEFNRRRCKAIQAAHELAEHLAYLSELDHGGLCLRIPADTLEASGTSATRIADALANQGNVADRWCEQSSGTAPAAVFVRALEKLLHGTDTYGLHGLNSRSGVRLLSYSNMATVTRVALDLPHGHKKNGTRFDAAHVREALKAYQGAP